MECWIPWYKYVRPFLKVIVICSVAWLYVPLCKLEELKSAVSMSTVYHDFALRGCCLRCTFRHRRGHTMLLPNHNQDQCTVLGASKDVHDALDADLLETAAGVPLEHGIKRLALLDEH